MTNQPITPRLGRARYITTAGIIAALYALITILSMQTLNYFSWGPIQLRISEALMVLALLTPAAIPGLTLGCFIANLYNLALVGPLGWFDVVFGTIATLLAALWLWSFRSRQGFALAGPVITNALIVPAYLPILLKGMGLYDLPLLPINVESSYLAMYVFGILSLGLSEAVVIYGLGLPLYKALEKYKNLFGEG